MEAKHSDEAPAPSLKKMGSALAGLLQGHLELVGIEIQEERARVFKLFLLASISLILGLLILVGLAVCISRAVRLAKESASPFQATVEELARNRERLLP